MGDTDLINAINKRLDHQDKRIDKLEAKYEYLQSQDHKTELVTKSLETTVKRLEDIVNVLQTKSSENWSKTVIIIKTAFITTIIASIVSILIEKFTHIF